jgi:hypothetical protein
MSFARSLKAIFSCIEQQYQLTVFTITTMTGQDVTGGMLFVAS